MNEIKHCQCEACKNGVIHESDCAVHNLPAFPVGKCSCAVSAALDMAMALDAALIKAGRKEAPVRTGE
ncbi:hypothetical protein ACW910_24315 (plasmid) [Burkholderia ambifaria]